MIKSKFTKKGYLNFITKVTNTLDGISYLQDILDEALSEEDDVLVDQVLEASYKLQERLDVLVNTYILND